MAQGITTQCFSYMLHSHGPSLSIPRTAPTFSNANFEGFFDVKGVLQSYFSFWQFVREALGKHLAGLVLGYRHLTLPVRG